MIYVLDGKRLTRDELRTLLIRSAAEKLRNSLEDASIGPSQFAHVNAYNSGALGLGLPPRRRFKLRKTTEADHDVSNEKRDRGGKWTKGGGGAAVKERPTKKPKKDEPPKKPAKIVAVPPEEFRQRMTSSPAFKKFFRESKVVDGEGKPLVVYHGTLSKVEAFDPNRSSPEEFMGRGFYSTDSPEDASQNYAREEGPDIRNRIDRLAEQIKEQNADKLQLTTDGKGDEGDPGDPEMDSDKAREIAKKQLYGEHGPQANVMPVYLSIQNPLVIGYPGDVGIDEATKDKSTRWDVDYEDPSGADPESDDYDPQPTGKLEEFYSALREAIEDFNDYGDDKIDADKVIDELREKFPEGGKAFEILQAAGATDELGQASHFNDDKMESEVYSAEIQRDALEKMGYDGIIDHGAGARWGQISSFKGMTPETTHYVVFGSTQIKSATGNKGTFDTSHSKVTESEHDVSTEPRDKSGEWTKGGGAPRKAAKIKTPKVNAADPDDEADGDVHDSVKPIGDTSDIPCSPGSAIAARNNPKRLEGDTNPAAMTKAMSRFQPFPISFDKDQKRAVSRGGIKVPAFDKAKHAKVIDYGADEVEWQIRHGGVKDPMNWYAVDFRKAVDEMGKAIPELKDEGHAACKDLFIAAVAMSSIQAEAALNIRNAGQLMIGLLDSNHDDPKRCPQFPIVRPYKINNAEDQKQFGVYKTSIQLFNYMLRDEWAKHPLVEDSDTRRELTFHNVINWFGKNHSLKEMIAKREAATVIGKDGKEEYLFRKGLTAAQRRTGKGEPYSFFKPGGKYHDGQEVFGFSVFGPKVGPFYNNLTGGHDVTIDSWETRCICRLFGQMNDQTLWSGKDQNPESMSPTSPGNRHEEFKQVVRDIARRWHDKYHLGEPEVNVEAVQAVQWMFEQQLWKSHGYKKASQAFFSTGAEKFIADARAAGWSRRSGHLVGGLQLGEGSGSRSSNGSPAQRAAARTKSQQPTKVP